MKGKRELLAHALAPTPVQSALRRLFGASAAVIFTYHRVCDPDELDDAVVSATEAQFEAQVRWLRANVPVLSGEELAAFATGQLQLPGPAVGITFDDGYADNLRAAEILHAHGVPAVFFVTSGFIGSRVPSDWDRLAYVAKHACTPDLVVDRIDDQGPWHVAAGRPGAFAALLATHRGVPPALQPRFIEALEAKAGARASDYLASRPPIWMNWDQVRRLRALGHTVGAHTVSHPILSALPADRQAWELRESRRQIEEQLQAPVDLFAYPVGTADTFTAETRRLAAECGFAAAFSFYGGTNRRGTFDRYEVRRTAVDRGLSPTLFRARAAVGTVVPI